MYARLPQLAALAAAAEASGDPRPVILCEYAHSMGNSTGDLREHWEAFEGPGRLQGGFIWDWADQALVKRGRSGGSGDGGEEVGREGREEEGRRQRAGRTARVEGHLLQHSSRACKRSCGDSSGLAQTVL
jgi:hypothetical protein